MSSGWENSCLSQSEQPLRAEQQEELARLAKIFSARGAYHKILSRQVRRTTATEASPQLVWGEAAPERFEICENGVRFELGFNEGYSTGLFLDQRDNRRRFLTGHVAAEFPFWRSEIGNWKSEILNVFAYTCGFSVCAAQGGRENDEPGSLEKISRMGPAQFRAKRPRPGGARFHLRRRFRLAAAAGEERARVRRGGARPADVFAIEGTRHVPRGKRLRQTRHRRATGHQAGRSFVCLDECDGLAAGEISRGRGNSGSRREAENFAAALRPATAGFSHQPRRTGVFENGMVEDRVAFGPASAFKSPAANIFYSTPYPSSRNRWSL